MNDLLKKGKGAQSNPKNRYSSQEITYDDGVEIDENVQVFLESPKKIISQFNSPDVPGEYSLDPYQGCEHGCVYCYARESHQYWGWSAGNDFESKIIVKQNAADLLKKTFESQSYLPKTIMLSGNTDCYQPLERKYKLTRSVLNVMVEHRNPVSIITKNSLIERDLDLITELNSLNLVHVTISITSLDESLRRVLEPRTSSAAKKLKTIESLSSMGIPVTVLIAPVIPGLNHHEIPEILRLSHEAGANTAGYTVVRLNGEISNIFSDWLDKTYPERKEKVLNQIRELHGGELEDRRFGKRMSGEGPYAKIIHQFFKVNKKKYFGVETKIPALDNSKFRRSGNWQLF